MVKVDDLDNMDVWKNQTDFDFDVWENGLAKLKLCSVPWDREYEHIVDWESDEQRDEYFQSLDGYVWEDETGWNFKSLEVFKPGLGKHEGTIPVDLPYESAMNYNYLFVELYEQPVPGGEGNRREVFFYFLTSLNKIAPSTTSLYLELDTVTTYFNSVKIEALNLHRGHYFHAQTSASKFLENPLENSFGLTEVEPELPDLKPKVSHTELISYSKNGPRVCIATTGDFTDRRSWFTVIPRNEADDPDTRQVGFPAAGQPGSMKAPWNQPFNKGRGDYEAYDSSYLKPSVKQQSNGKGTTESLNVYSMAPEDFPKFVAYARQSMQQILPTIQAIYVLDSAVIDEADAFTQWGFSFSMVRQSSSPKLLSSLKLDEDHFGYSDAAKGFAKLYTQQFAKIEISNNQGGTAEISIEEISETLDFYSRASSLFPFLKLEALIDGVGGRGVKKYTVKPLGTVEASNFLSQWESYSFDLDVPIYSIRVDKTQDIAQQKKVQRDQEARKAKAKQDYTKKSAEVRWLIGSTNLTTENVVASNLAEKDLRNAYASLGLNYNNRAIEITTDYQIATDTNLKDYLNANRAVATEFGNAQASTALAFNNAQVTAQNEKGNADLSADTVWLNSSRSIAAEFRNANDSADLPYEYWFQLERGIEGDKYQKTVEWKNTLFDTAWRLKYDLYTTMKAAAQATGGMSILTSANVANLGAIGSGISSIPAGSIAAGDPVGSWDRAGNWQDGISNFSPGAVAGVAVLNLLEKAISVEVNAAIWRFQAMENNILNADYANEQMTLRDTTFYYAGKGVKKQEWDTSYQTAGETWLTEQFFLNLEYNNLITLRDDIENRRRTLAYDIAELNRYTASQNTDDTQSNTKLVASRNLATAMDVATRTYDVSEDINVANRDRGTFILEADYAQNIANANLRKETGETVNEATRQVSVEIADRDNLVARNNITARYQSGLWINDSTRDLTDLGADVDYGVSQADWTSELLTEIQGEPSEYGQNDGRAQTDIWGMRGISIRVRRCSDAVAQQAAGIFSRYGYTTGGIWVESPELSVMTDFTYWRADSVWLTGDRINETNKEIFRRLFERGVTIWSDPTLIFNTRLADNQPA